MFEINVRGVRLGASFSFFAVIALLFLCGGAMTGDILTALACCALHELGHLFFMTLFSCPPQSVVLYGGGIRIMPDTGKMISQSRDIVILLAGCGVNFLAAAIAYAANGADIFCCVNLLLGVFNLMPFKYFDGGRVLETLCGGRAVSDYIRAAFILLSAVCIIFVSFFGSVSISLTLTFCFVAVSELLYD